MTTPNQEASTHDNREIGHGVVYAYLGASLSLTAMVLGGYAPWGTVAGLIGIAFLFILIDDHLIQQRDMQTPGGYQPSSEVREGGQEATDG